MIKRSQDSSSIPDALPPTSNDGVRTLAKVKTGKSGGKQSMTRHPLFPATVALWFGALFGVGSLAIRPSLIEGLIVSSGIDLIIPAAAPPMGVTTRILIALALAAIGGTLGAWLARRLGKPKSVAVTRKRGAPSAEAKGALRSQSAQAGGARRSRLALSEEGGPRREYVDHAPLPGQANILDVSQFDLEGFEAEEPDRIEAIETIEAIHEDLSLPIAEAPILEPEVPARRLPEGAQVFQPVESELHSAEETQDLHREAPAISAVEPVREAAQVFLGDAAPPFAPPADWPAVTAPETAMDDADPVEATPAPVEEPAARAPFAAPKPRAPFSAPADRVSFTPEMIDITTSDEIAPPTPFAWEASDPSQDEETPLSRLGSDEEAGQDLLLPKVRPGSIFDQKPATSLFAQPLNTQVSHFGWESGMSGEARSALPVTAPEVTAKATEPQEPSVQPSEPACAPVDPVAAERIAGAPLGDLSPVELLERLALSMRRKQTAARQAEAQSHSDEFDAVEPVASQPEAVSAEEPQFAPVQPPVPVIPAALRPIGFDDEDDSDDLPAFVPPRHFGQPQTDAEPASFAPPASPHPAQPVADVPQAAALPAPGEADELDQGYSSLLSLSRPGVGQQRFVRIEEPSPVSREIEQVVIFPGKEPVSGEGPFARPSVAFAAPAADQGGERRAQDPEETERALRTALANIQRMSGAA